MTRDELLEQLLLERHNGGGWRPTRPAPRDPDVPRAALEWDDSEVTCRRRQRELLDAVKHVPIKENEEEETA
ncbi:MAG TPA: hypothetical protein VIP28_14630 [Nocardioides sp.]